MLYRILYVLIILTISDLFCYFLSPVALTKADIKTLEMLNVFIGVAAFWGYGQIYKK